MRKMGFEEKWIRLIMLCISSVKYQFKVDGVLSDVVVPQRGLRQGDPMSPYIFVICAEAFSSLLNKADVDESLERESKFVTMPRVSTIYYLQMTLWY